MAIACSVVIPVFNERESLAALHARLTSVLAALGEPYELLFVNDGSSDGSDRLLDELAGKDPKTGAIHLRRNFGKAAALDAGFRRARGEFVVTIDADLQDAPEEIPRMLAKLREGFDVVSGWKQHRHDPLSKRLPSLLFNFVVRRACKVALHDFNCGLKAYRREALAELPLYGEMHRYIPVLLNAMGFGVTELVVRHDPRRFGVSKYGLGRLFKGLFDFITVLLNTRYRARPLHMFGLAGLCLGAAGLGTLSYLTVLWFLGARPIGQRPLLMLGLLLVMVGVQIVSTGLLAELVNRQIQRSDAYYTVRAFRAPADAPK